MGKKTKRQDQDSMQLKTRKGTWLRYLKVFAKIRLPWLWIAIYLAVDLGGVNLGINETDYTARLMAGETTAAVVTTLVLLILLRLLVSSASIFFRQVASGRMIQNTRDALVGKVLRLPMRYFQGEASRDAVYRIVSKATVIESSFIVVLLPLITAGYTAVGVFSRVANYDWRLSAILLGFIPVQIFLAFLFGRLNYFLNNRETAVNAGLVDRLAEMVANIPLAKAFAKEDKEADMGERLTMRLYRLSIRGSWLDQLRDISQSGLDLVQSALITVVAYSLFQAEIINLRAWTSFFVFSSLFTSSVREFTMYWNNLKIIQGGAEWIGDIMEQPEESQAGAPCGNLAGDIALQNVNFSYIDGHPVLRDLSCTFEDGKITALLGESGCGKTTVANLLLRLYEPDQGTITIGTNTAEQYALDSYRQQFVMVSQTGMLFSGTVRENMQYGNGAVSDEAVWDALEQAGAAGFVRALPGDLDGRVEEYGNNFSGGQRQRLAVARALLSESHYLIFDEPSASMDAIATAELLDVLKQVSQNRCTIIIAHTPAVMRIADRVVVLDKGQLAAQGALEDVVSQSAFLQDFMEGKVRA